MEEIDLKELIQMFLEKKFLILIVVVLFAILGVGYTQKVVVPIYKSSTSLVLVQTGTERAPEEMTAASEGSITTSDLTLNSKLVNIYTEIAESDIVASTVHKNLKLDMSLEQLKDCIVVSTKSNTELITVAVTHTEPKKASTIANEVAKVFIEKVQEIYKVENLYVLDVAKIPEEPSNINLGKNVVIFSFVGLILVAGYILLVNMLDTTIKTDTDIMKSTDLPVLASIVLTGDNAKKKIKKNIKEATEKTENDENIPFSNNVQIFYEEENFSDDNMSFYSYINDSEEDEDENTSRVNRISRRNNKKRGGNK